MQQQRIYERDTDRLFIAALRRDPAIGAEFLKGIGPSPSPVTLVKAQTRHVGSTGTIDIDITYGDGTRLMVENKIDAGYSITRIGEDQPTRYHRTIVAYRSQGSDAYSLLLAPAGYLASNRATAAFDSNASYESFLGLFDGEDRTPATSLFLDYSTLKTGRCYWLRLNRPRRLTSRNPTFQPVCFSSTIASLCRVGFRP